MTTPRDLPPGAQAVVRKSFRGYAAGMPERNQPDRPNASDNPDAPEIVSPDDPSLTDYDKELADSFPASDPPSQP